MARSTYALPVQPVVMADDTNLVAELSVMWFGDYAEGNNEVVRDFNIADAMAASGDYFITLATRLDKLAQGMPQDSSEQIELEHQVQLLFYMQEHYDLVAKYKRQ